jgi:hypothetical protein
MTGNNIEEKPISSSEEAHASLSPQQESDLEWMIHVATWHSTTSELLGTFSRSGSSMKTSQAFCRLTKDTILPPSWGKWSNSGMGSPTEFLTLNTSEFPNEGEESLLSDVLMAIGEVPQQFYLTKRACAGILRRANRRGKVLPSSLKEALEMKAGNWEEEEE